MLFQTMIFFFFLKTGQSFGKLDYTLCHDICNNKVNEGSENWILNSAKTNIVLRQEDVLFLELKVHKHKNVSSVYDAIDC